MIYIWYRHRGQRPKKTEAVRKDANKANTLPSSFEVVGVKVGRRLDDGTVDNNQFALRVEPPSDNISQDAIDAIGLAFEDNWCGSIEFVESEVK